MNLPLLRCVFLLAVLTMPHAAPARDGPTSWRIGAWKTAQTIQPFLYEQFNPGV